MTVAWTRHVATTGVGGNPGNGGGIWPAGALTALFIVVFGSERDIRLAQDGCAATALEAMGAAAAKATVCGAGATNVLATTSVVTTVATTTDARGRVSMCNTANLQFSGCFASTALISHAVEVPTVGARMENRWDDPDAQVVALTSRWSAPRESRH